ncbi:hypothetical protein P4Q63_005300 [Salmonella enterica]|nr:hypothetical protein [Salmonella enterica]EKQ0893656.1 hypothetical protein [Salmonella enterica]
MGLNYKEIHFSNNAREYVAAVLASIFIGSRYDSKVFNKYVDIVSGLNVDDFAYAITCLYETYEEKKIPFFKEEEINITLAILTRLRDVGCINFDEYKRRLLHAISGAYKGDKYLVRDNGHHMPLYGWDS